MKLTFNFRLDLQEMTIMKERGMYINHLRDCTVTLLLHHTTLNMFNQKNMEGAIELTWTTTQPV